MVKNILNVTAVFLSFIAVFLYWNTGISLHLDKVFSSFPIKKNRYKKMLYRFDFVGVRINRFLRAN